MGLRNARLPARDRVGRDSGAGERGGGPGGAGTGRRRGCGRFSSHEVTHFDTPRRLAVMAAGIAASQAEVVEQITGPSVNVAYKDGQPTPAAHAFAKKAGVEIAQLEKVTTPKGEYLTAKVTKKGRSAAEILAEGLPKELSTIYWPKNM